ncbi:MAG: isoprenylcysteine carboxylmethyltransferase family protein [Deltaproteobacteria bacterium]|nr:isoprenylcysteine carboxylmethyltransferase family protein [Deltaproteobacteria bacterium]
MIALRGLLPCIVMGLVLFGCAGRIDVWTFWAWLAVMWGTFAAIYTRLEKTNPELVRERMKPPSDRDRATRRLVALPFLAMLVIAGLDVRFGWTPVSTTVSAIGLVFWFLGLAISGWVLFANPYASSAVRIQDERGQRVIDTGPYAFVRHPMYTAVVVVCLACGPALGSWLAGLCALPVIVIFLRRTSIEDRMLHGELAGYVDYAARVRWRVVPFVY